ncbi:hypothetical protein [Arthrobacter sp. 92]|uniref:hypothetical protein n=1 Tax=Arthrobacter sp. 92 TaxID=3418175 RepID=UPI003D019D59
MKVDQSNEAGTVLVGKETDWRRSAYGQKGCWQDQLEGMPRTTPDPKILRLGHPLHGDITRGADWLHTHGQIIE